MSIRGGQACASRSEVERVWLEWRSRCRVSFYQRKIRVTFAGRRLRKRNERHISSETMSEMRRADSRRGAARALSQVPAVAGIPAHRSGKGAFSKSPPPTLEQLAAAFPQLEILEFIGQGGMGFVFKARQPKLDRFVALKILPQSLATDPAFAERFTREGRMLARLNHPNIVTIHDFGQANGYFYLLMEFVDGVNLRQAMRAGRLHPSRRWRSCRKSARRLNSRITKAYCIATSSRRTSCWIRRGG